MKRRIERDKPAITLMWYPSKKYENSTWEDFSSQDWLNWNLNKYILKEQIITISACQNELKYMHLHGNHDSLPRGCLYVNSVWMYFDIFHGMLLEMSIWMQLLPCESTVTSQIRKYYFFLKLGHSGQAPSANLYALLWGCLSKLETACWRHFHVRCLLSVMNNLCSLTQSFSLFSLETNRYSLAPYNFPCLSKEILKSIFWYYDHRNLFITLFFNLFVFPTIFLCCYCIQFFG